MTATSNLPLAALTAAPATQFEIVDARAAEHVAVPTLLFALRISAPDGQPIRSMLLDIQIQIAARRRGYSEIAQQRLLELFGTPERWGSTLRTLPWMRTTVVVPPFERQASVDVAVPCTYDLEVIAARYLAALGDGEIPLELLFSGSVFYTAAQGALQVARIALDQEVDYRLPVATWKRAMERHFPGSAWLRVSDATFAGLCAYKARHAFLSWDAALDALLQAGEGE